MPVDYAISLMRLRPNEAGLFDQVSSKLKYLHVILAT
jgi:hypothetical protein